jgi:uncharacterized protein with HEPN domain
MNDLEKKYLLDIKNSIENIETHLGRQKIFESYIKNITIRRAVERELEIIGEATSRLVKIRPDIKISYVRIIINLRNRVIHAYDTVDHNIIWKIVVNDLPVLKTEIEKLLIE